MALSGFDLVTRRMELACERAGVCTDAVELVVVSKGRSDDAVRAVYRAGARVFGENREQGLVARFDSDWPADLSWHFVGHVQSRKAASIGSRVDLLQSMDRLKLASAWSSRSTAPVLVQFNLAGEPQKSGFDPAEAEAAVDSVLAAGVDIRGVMAIPPFAEDPEDTRPWFAMLRAIFDRLSSRHPSFTVCSMGMSNDFEVAIEEGATMVRVGRAIFAGMDGQEA